MDRYVMRNLLENSAMEVSRRAAAAPSLPAMHANIFRIIGIWPKAYRTLSGSHTAGADTPAAHGVSCKAN